MTMLMTYHGDANLKAAFLTEIGKHEAADQLVKGHYGKMNGQFTGCGIGCSLHSLNLIQGRPPMERTREHLRIQDELGWPLWLAYAEDHLFESLPDDLSKTWPRRLAEAIPVGVTVPAVVLARFLRWQLLDARFGVVHAADAEEVKNVVRRMGALFDRTIAGENVSEAEWHEAARGAWDTRAARAAWAAWDARAAWAAWDARDAQTRDAFYPALSEELLRLLRELTPSLPLTGTKE